MHLTGAGAGANVQSFLLFSMLESFLLSISNRAHIQKPVFVQHNYRRAVGTNQPVLSSLLSVNVAEFKSGLKGAGKPEGALDTLQS